MFLPAKTDNADGLSPVKEDHAGSRKTGRKDIVIFMGVSYEGSVIYMRREGRFMFIRGRKRSACGEQTLLSC